MIHGVTVTPLRQIVDERGKVMKMLSRDDDVFSEFGEIYFSVVNPGVVKGWHLHRDMTLNYACVDGLVRFVLYDDREGSPTRGDTDEHLIGPERYSLVTVPPGIWSGFKGLGDVPSMVANCATLPHDPDEISRLDPDDASIGYDWARQGGDA